MSVNTAVKHCQFSSQVLLKRGLGEEWDLLGLSVFSCLPIVMIGGEGLLRVFGIYGEWGYELEER